mgnify:CR=1 FL=1
MTSWAADDPDDDELTSDAPDAEPDPEPEPVSPELELLEDVTQLYLNEIGAKPLLTPGEELATARLVSAGEGLETTLDIRIYRERHGTRKAKGSLDAFWNDLQTHLAK